LRFQNQAYDKRCGYSESGAGSIGCERLFIEKTTSG
jgi:hypothetical protein